MSSTDITVLLLMSTERGSSYIRTTSLGAKWAKESKFCAGAWKLKILRRDSVIEIGIVRRLIKKLGPVALNDLKYFMAWELKAENIYRLDDEKLERLKRYILTLPPYNQKQNGKRN